MSEGNRYAVDPVALARALIRCPSVTPSDSGALGVVQKALENLGFLCHRLPFSEPGTDTVDNLFARIGDGSPQFCFAGHTDVVPVGEPAAWRHDPFGAEIDEDMLYGRGAVDMKGAVACFVAAAAAFLEACDGTFDGSLGIILTGDEEGPGRNGTRKVLSWMKARGTLPDVCLVGEPTSPSRLGEMVKIGRRGSLTGRLRVQGTQGHVAYPHLADNPIPRLLAVLSDLTARRLDEGSEHFPPSRLEVTTIDVGNPAPNVIPAGAAASFNIRFNDHHSGDGLGDWIRRVCAKNGGRHDLDLEVNGDAFLTPPGNFSDMICAAIERILGRRPELSTTGGTSDARFIKDYCPVAEFGLVGATMHAVDERVAVDDLYMLTHIYSAILNAYFNRSVTEPNSTGTACPALPGGRRVPGRRR